MYGHILKHTTASYRAYTRAIASSAASYFSAASKKRRKQSSYDHHLIRVVDSEIKFASQSELLDFGIDVPDSLPFKVEDNAGERFIELKRDYQNEVIKIKVDLQNARCECAPEDSALDDGNNVEPQPSIPVIITVSKHNLQCLQFDANVSPDRIRIQGLTLKESESSSYTGPDFLDLSESLQKCFQQYLEARGLTPTTANFLLEYVICKETKEYLRWLKTLKKIIEI